MQVNSTKKIFLVMMCIIMAVGLIACGQSTEDKIESIQTKYETLSEQFIEAGQLIADRQVSGQEVGEDTLAAYSEVGANVTTVGNYIAQGLENLEDTELDELLETLASSITDTQTIIDTLQAE